MYEPTKQVLEQIDRKLQADKNIANDKKEGYIRIIKELNWSLGKVAPIWPPEIERIVDNMKSVLEEFESHISQMSKGSSIFCGSSGNPKQLDQVYKRVLSYEYIFNIIGVYQDKKIKEDIVSNVIELLDKEKMISTSSKK